MQAKHFCCLAIFIALASLGNSLEIKDLLVPQETSDFLDIKKVMSTNDNQFNSVPLQSVAFDRNLLPNYGVRLDSPNNNVSMLVMITSISVFVDISSKFKCGYFKPFPSRCRVAGAAIWTGSLTLDNTYYSVYCPYDVSIANGSWSFISGFDTSFMEMNSCDYPYILNNNSYGMLGLGYSNNNQNFKQDNVLFSIYLNPITSDGGIIFGVDSTKMASSTPIMTIPSDLDWQTNLTQITFGDLLSYTPPNNLNDSNSVDQIYVVFELLVDTISLPPVVYQQFIDKISSLTDMQCSDRCYYEGDISSLPDLVITASSGALNISIPAQIYMNTDESGTYVNVHAYGISYYSYVVLGSKVMSQYYTVFQENQDQQTGTITLYAPANSSGVSSD